MYLRNFLHFVGDARENTIQFSSLKNRWKNRLIEVDDYSKFWSFLKDISKESPALTVAAEQQFWLEELKSIGAVQADSGVSEHKKIYAVKSFLGERATSVEVSLGTAVVIGVGTVGSSLAGKLLEHGVRSLRLFDFDSVEEQNLGFQRFYRSEHIGKNKAECLKLELETLFGHTQPSIDALPRRLTGSDFSDNEANKKLTIFIAADELSSREHEIICEAIRHGATVIRAGYGLFICGASVYDTEESYQQDLIREEDLITENIGGSIEGDIAASLMVRAWLARDFLDVSANRFSVDTFLENGQFEYSPHVELDDIYRNDDIQRAYMNFIRSGDEKYWDLIKETDSLNEFVEAGDEYLSQYENELAEAHVEINGTPTNISDFVHQRLFEKHSIESETSAASALERLRPAATQLIMNRQPPSELLSDEMLELDNLVRLLVDVVHNNTLDLADFSTFATKGYSFLEAIEIVKKSYGPVPVSHLFSDGYLERGTQDVTIYRILEGKSYVFLDYNERLIDLLSMAHEVSHAYYNQFHNQKFRFETDDLLTEVCGIVGEFRLFDHLTSAGLKSELNFLKKLRLTGILLGHYSLVHYRDKIYTELANTGNWDIRKTRAEFLSNFLPGVTIKNPEVTDLNVVTSVSFLNGEEIAVYVRALIYAAAVYGLHNDSLEEYLTNERGEKSFSRFVNFLDTTREELLSQGINTLKAEILSLKYQ